VFALLGVFVLSLGLPQVGALRHKHPGGDHAHIHAEFANSPVALLHAHQGKAALPHAHPHLHHEADYVSHVHHIHPHHPHHKITAKKNRRLEFTYYKPKPPHGMHWHAVNVFQHATSTHLTFLPPALSSLSSPVFVQTFLLILALLVVQPRAPPDIVNFITI
jgi:hypothetical protein